MKESIKSCVGTLLLKSLFVVLILVSSLLADETTYKELGKYGFPSEATLYGRYALAYNGRTRCPDWVLEKLDKVQLKSTIKRNGRFYSDSTIPIEFRPNYLDYAASGYDIGHMAPFNTHRTSEEDGLSTFVLSNTVPQVPSFNRGLWFVLEFRVQELSIKHPVWVITCPLWLPSEEGKIEVKTIGQNKVWVPTHCGKSVLIEKEDGTIELKSWILPNKGLHGHRLDEFVVSVDEFEAALGHDVWKELPDEIEGVLENTK